MFDTEEAVDALCAAVGPDERPAWTVFDRDDGEADGFALVTSPGALVGWWAPAEVWAIGVVAGGTATLLADGSVTEERCQVACVVDRWGEASGRIRFASSVDCHREDVLYEAPQDGRLLDILRRCMRLDTAPASDPVSGVLSLLWLVDVAIEAERQGSALRWADAVRFHPVASLLDGSTRDHGGGDPTATRRSGDTLESLIDQALETWGWADVLQRCVEGHVTISDVTPEVASWMDEGTFSRWLAEGVRGADVIIELGFRSVASDDHPALRRSLMGALDPPPHRRGRSCGIGSRRRTVPHRR